MDRPMRILWGSPLPPTRSGVADYAVELLPALVQLVPVRVLEPPGWERPEDWPEGLETVPADTVAADNEIELIHLGNNPYHLWLLPRLRRGGAVVVLHDAVLHHLLVESAREANGSDVLERELEAAHGDAGSRLVAARAAGHHGRLDPFLFPARSSLLRHAAAVITHSKWAAGVVAADLPDKPVRTVALAAADPNPVDRTAERRALGLADDDVVLMHLGFLTPEKGLEEILAGFGSALRMRLPGRLVVVGEGSGGESIGRAADRAGFGNRVRTTGWIEASAFPRVPAAADLGVVYRRPSAGETSAAALRFFACGVPVAVVGRKQFLEWPEPAAPRLTPGAPAAADLARLLGEIGRPGWSERGKAARELYERAHRPATAAAQLVDALRSVVSG